MIQSLCVTSTSQALPSVSSCCTSILYVALSVLITKSGPTHKVLGHSYFFYRTTIPFLMPALLVPCVFICESFKSFTAPEEMVLILHLKQQGKHFYLSWISFQKAPRAVQGCCSSSAEEVQNGSFSSAKQAIELSIPKGEFKGTRPFPQLHAHVPEPRTSWRSHQTLQVLHCQTGHNPQRAHGTQMS